MGQGRQGNGMEKSDSVSMGKLGKKGMNDQNE